MSLLDRHMGFVEALRRAGLPVSMSEDLDAVAALSMIPWADRDLVRATYAGTLVKKHLHQHTFNGLFDLFFPVKIGGGVEDAADWAEKPEAPTGDNLDVLESMRRRIQKVLETDDLDPRLLSTLATEAVSRFGANPAAPTGAQRWSMYETLQRLDMHAMTKTLIERMMSDGAGHDEADARAQSQAGKFVQAVADDIERRRSEQETPQRRASETVRQVLDTMEFVSATQRDLAAMRSEVQPLARRLATRLARERRAHGGGPLDFRRTIRASMASGGVPLVTHHRPKRPHRTDLVVLCDISGSVADFARFTLMFVFALREVFQSLRAFTFVDAVTEVTDLLQPGADISQVLADLAGSTREALLNGKSNYGRVFKAFSSDHDELLTPRTTLLILGDARSNHSELGRTALTGMGERVRSAYWLNPEPGRSWATGDSATNEYAQIVKMVEVSNLKQLSAFVHDIV